jgi:hypothetical protein
MTTITDGESGSSVRTKLNASLAMTDLLESSPFIWLPADYTLADQTTAQKLFNAPANGALTLGLGLYEFRSFIYVTGMSATSGNNDLNLLGAGTATLSGQTATAFGRDQATLLVTTITGAMIYAANQFGGDVQSPTTGTAVWHRWSGVFKVTVAGTIIPSILLTTGGVTPVVKAGSHIIVTKIAEDGVNSRGAS